jgi:DNA-directed RNA polymerase
MSESKIKEEKALALKAIEKQTEAYKNLAEIINKELEGEGELSDKSSKHLKDYIEKNIESLTMFEPELTSSEIFNRVIKEVTKTKK